MRPAAPDFSVSILLATYEGARFLGEQLASIAAQTVPRVDLYASDDGSTDGTPALLAEWQQRWTKGRFVRLEGPRRGFAENFRSLMQLELDTDYVAFSDQDDIWDPDKLEAAIARLGGTDDRPRLYVSRTRLVDEHGGPMGHSPLFRRPPGFRNALVQNIGGGNTAVLNRAGFALVRESARRTRFVSHDWWCYILVTGAGGEVIYDPAAHIAYRQHPANAVGRNTGWIARLLRLRALLAGRFARWTEENLQALECCCDLLSREAADTIAALRETRTRRGIAALAALRRSGLFRQTSFGQMGLVLAAMMGAL
jgi:glycosyltransferase involved in cell wall biosynthesis